MTTPAGPAELGDLFATPPPEFVATRNALAKRLRAEKRRDEAGAVAKLRRPSWIDWALNAVAASQPEVVGDFADAAEVLREAQAASIEGRDGPDLRGALRALRDATTALARQAGRELSGAGRDPETAELTSRLGEIAGLEAAVEQLRGGVLGSADPGEDDLFAGLTPAPPSRARPTPTTATTTRTPSKRAGGGAAAGADRAAAEREEQEREEEEREDAKRAKEEAEVAAAAARARETERRELERGVDEARRRRADAAERFAAAQRALDDARADLDDADERLEAASAGLDRFDADTLAS